jgi:general secretion pathway protein L
MEEGLEPGTPGAASLTWAHPEGVARVRLHGGLARALLPNPIPPTTRWSTSPAAAAAAEQWLGAPVTVMPLEQRLLQAGRSLWNLRQFDLAPRTRGARALRDSVRSLLSPKWRPVRIGAAALLLAQVIGLNAWAWHERSEIERRRAELQALVKASFPRVSELDIQRDPAAVMQRETQALRALAGKPGDGDFEPLLYAAAAAWPPGRPVENLRFEPGKLSLAATGWNEAQIESFRNALKPGGWQVDATEGRVTVSRPRRGASV